MVRSVIRFAAILLLAGNGVWTLVVTVLWARAELSCRADACSWTVLFWGFWIFTQVFVLPAAVTGAAVLIWDRARRHSQPAPE